LKGEIAIDPGDMEDFVDQFFEQNDMPMPSRENPEKLPDYREVTLTSFAVYLTERRATLLGWGKIEA
jgi:hypothetical protein